MVQKRQTPPARRIYAFRKVIHRGAEMFPLVTKVEEKMSPQRNSGF